MRNSYRVKIKYIDGGKKHCVKAELPLAPLNMHRFEKARKVLRDRLCNDNFEIVAVQNDWDIPSVKDGFGNPRSYKN